MYFKLFLFSLIFVLLRISTINSQHYYKLFSNHSLCGGLLNDVSYDLSKDSCQLPCTIITSYVFITSQKDNKCRNSSTSITINGNIITSTSDVVVKQHKKGQQTKIISEIIEVVKVNITNEVSKWYFHFIPQKIKGINQISKLSVHFIVFDGGSRYVLKHQLRQTTQYLKSIRNEYSMFDMLKYHTIDLNSFSHYSSLYYGYRIKIAKQKTNKQKIIFDDFKDENYITINTNTACDVNENFLIHNNYSGSDHNLNPASCDSNYKKNIYTTNTRCLGDRQIHQHYFDYLKEALLYYHSKQQPVFSNTILLDSHDSHFKSIPRVDYDFTVYLKYLNDNGIMNKSMIIITADHGMHYGKYYNSKVYKILIYYSLVK